MAPLGRFKLVYFVPVSALAITKKAIFEAGAGRYPNYAECCFQTLGKGQFRPVDDAKPNIGEVGKLEEVEEMRVETVIDGLEKAKKVVEALKKAHPYEEVAYEVYKLEDV